MNYSLAYRFGFHPWEDALHEPEFVSKITELFAREEAGRERPFGKALDLGTGSGIWGVELAKRGWEVTGIDLVEAALGRARSRAQQQDVQVRFLRGDVTALREAGTGVGYRLLLDSGTFHDFDEAQRLAMGREVSAVAATDATLLLLAWPKRRRPLIRGVSREEIQAAFPDWTIRSVEPSFFQLPKPLDWVLRPDEHWYTLRRAPLG